MDLREAAGALGVHYQTAYAWVRQGVLPARKVGRGYEISEADARELAARRRQGYAAARGPSSVRDWAAQSRQLYEALAKGDETLARKRLARLAGGVPLLDLCEHVIGAGAPPHRRRLGGWPRLDRPGAPGQCHLRTAHRRACQSAGRAGRAEWRWLPPRRANGTACPR